MKRHATQWIVSLALIAGLFASVSAEAAGASKNPHRPRIGLVLAGGGAKGAAHIGVLKVLEEMRIPIDAIAGTSMGSLVGGGYAAGLPADELEKRVTGVDWGALFDDDPPRSEWPERRKEATTNPTWNFTIGVRDGEFRLPKGAISGQKVQLFFNELVAGAETTQDFDALPIRYRAVATDLENGEMRVFDHGPLPIAMRASMAVPGVFAPIEWQDRIYVDGGLVRNLPVDVARSMGVDSLIVVNLGSSFLPRERLGTILGVTGQMIAILTEQNVQASLKEIDPKRDVLIVPKLGDITSSDFARAGDAVQTGVVAAREAMPQLARFSLSEAEYQAWRDEHFGRGQPVRRVGDVRIQGLQRVNKEVFDNLKTDQEDKPFNRKRLEDDIQAVYGRGDFERVSYRFEPQGRDEETLIIDAVEKAWGPGYLGIGLGLSSDNQGDSRFGLRATFNQTWVNNLGAEWSTQVTLGNAPQLYTEFYQPLSMDRSAFVAPYFDAKRSPDSLFIDDQRVARYDVTRLRAGADLGTTFSGVEVRAGAYLGQSEFSLDTGALTLPEGRVTESGARARIVYDTLDSMAAPRSGFRVALEALSPLAALGADVDYNRAFLTAMAARSFGPHTIAMRAKGGTSFGTDLPYYDQFPLGGFLDLSGYANEQFRGEDMAFAGLAYYRQIATLPPPLGRGLYLGASLEAGWLSDSKVLDARTGQERILSKEATRYGGSVFFGSDTWIGPAYLGLGLSGDGDNTIYVLFGQP